MSPVTSRSRRLALAGAAGLLTFAGLAGCSSDTTDDTATASSASPSASAPADVCSDVTTAQASLEALVGTKVVEEGTNTLKARFATFKADVQTLLEAGRAELAPKVESVETSIAELENVVADLKQDPTAADAALVRPTLQEIKMSTEELVAAVEERC
jgi:hypothetical protein